MKFSREINHIFDTFCRTWKSDAKAKLNLSAENPIVKAALELDLRKLDEAPPGVSAATGGHLGTTFLNMGAITPLGAAPAGFAQQCPRCDNFLSPLPRDSLSEWYEASF